MYMYSQERMIKREEEERVTSIHSYTYGRRTSMRAYIDAVKGQTTYT